MPPACCRADVTASFKRIGAHYQVQISGYPRPRGRERVLTLRRPYIETRYKKRNQSSFRIMMAIRRFPSTSAPWWLSAYEKCPVAASIIPTMLSDTIKVKNFRYVLNQRPKSSHRLILAGTDLGFGTTGSASAAKLALRSFGNTSDSSAVLGLGVRPSCTGELGDSHAFDD